MSDEQFRTYFTFEDYEECIRQLSAQLVEERANADRLGRLVDEVRALEMTGSTKIANLRGGFPVRLPLRWIDDSKGALAAFGELVARRATP